jgi:hypothetical protein
VQWTGHLLPLSEMTRAEKVRLLAYLIAALAAFWIVADLGGRRRRQNPEAVAANTPPPRRCPPAAKDDPMRTLLPRSLAPLFALVAIGLAFGHAFSAETPLGRVEGRVVLADTRKPLSGVDVTLTPAGDGDGAAGGAEADTRQRRRATTGPDGRFTLSGVAAGKYTVSAYTRAHRIDEAVVVVHEGETAPLPLALVRSEPDLQVAQHQRVFTVGEAAYLPVRGYVDGDKPANTDTVRVRVFETRLSRVLQDEAGAQALERIGRPYDEKPSRLPGALLKPAGGAITRRASCGSATFRSSRPTARVFQQAHPARHRQHAGLFLVDVTTASGRSLRG